MVEGMRWYQRKRAQGSTSTNALIVAALMIMGALTGIMVALLTIMLPIVIVGALLKLPIEGFEAARDKISGVSCTVTGALGFDWCEDIRKHAEDSGYAAALRASLDCSNFSADAIADGSVKSGKDCAENALGLAENGPIPKDKQWLVPVMMRAGVRYKVSWEVLAAVLATKSYFAQQEENCGARSGMFKFTNTEWALFSVDAGSAHYKEVENGCWDTLGPGEIRPDGKKDARDPVDAIFTEARLLANSGAARKLSWNAYNGAEGGDCKVDEDLDGQVYRWILDTPTSAGGSGGSSALTGTLTAVQVVALASLGLEKNYPDRYRKPAVLTNFARHAAAESGFNVQAVHHNSDTYRKANNGSDPSASYDEYMTTAKDRGTNEDNYDLGLWQINVYHHWDSKNPDGVKVSDDPTKLFDPFYNAQLIATIKQGGNGWTLDKTGPNSGSGYGESSAYYTKEDEINAAVTEYLKDPGKYNAEVLTIPATGSTGGTGAGGAPAGTYPGDTAPKATIARWMYTEAQAQGVPGLLPVMAALTESSLYNNPGGDADSKGYFQMRAGIWDTGKYQGYYENPQLQIQWFIDTAVDRAKNGGMPTRESEYGAFIQRIEQSAYPDRYQTHLQEAKDMIAGTAGSESAAPPGVVPAPVGSAPRLAYGTKPSPGVTYTAKATTFGTTATDDNGIAWWGGKGAYSNQVKWLVAELGVNNTPAKNTGHSLGSLPQGSKIMVTYPKTGKSVVTVLGEVGAGAKGSPGSSDDAVIDIWNDTADALGLPDKVNFYSDVQITLLPDPPITLQANMTAAQLPGTGPSTGSVVMPGVPPVDKVDFRDPPADGSLWESPFKMCAPAELANPVPGTKTTSCPKGLFYGGYHLMVKPKTTVKAPYDGRVMGVVVPTATKQGMVSVEAPDGKIWFFRSVTPKPGLKAGATVKAGAAVATVTAPVPPQDAAAPFVWVEVWKKLMTDGRRMGNMTDPKPLLEALYNPPPANAAGGTGALPGTGAEVPPQDGSGTVSHDQGTVDYAGSTPTDAISVAVGARYTTSLSLRPGTDTSKSGENTPHSPCYVAIVHDWYQAIDLSLNAAGTQTDTAVAGDLVAWLKLQADRRVTYVLENGMSEFERPPMEVIKAEDPTMVDCSAYTRWAYGKFAGFEIGGSTGPQWNGNGKLDGKPCTATSDDGSVSRGIGTPPGGYKIGDLVFRGNVCSNDTHHVIMYAGNGDWAEATGDTRCPIRPPGGPDLMDTMGLHCVVIFGKQRNEADLKTWGWVRYNNVDFTATGIGASGGGGTIANPGQVSADGWLTAPAASGMKVVKKPIDYSAARIAHMAGYAKRHYGIDNADLTPKAVVWHYTAGGTMEGAFSTFNVDKQYSANPGDPKYPAEYPGTCSHFIVDKDGTIYQTVSLKYMCRHMIGFNDKSVGIEMVQENIDDDSTKTAQAILNRTKQANAVLWLTGSMMAAYQIPLTSVVGHAEANASPLFKDLLGQKNNHSDWTTAPATKLRERLQAQITANPTNGSAPTGSTEGFTGTSSALTSADRQRMLGRSWVSGCPTPLADLRIVRVTYKTEAGGVATGSIVVNKGVADDTIAIFKDLYASNYPIHKMQPIDAYYSETRSSSEKADDKNSDWKSIEDNNTSAFNCRLKTDSSGEWSNHAKGLAIDINPIENPWVESSDGKSFSSSHPASKPYLSPTQRAAATNVKVIKEGSAIAQIFTSRGWRWLGPKDYPRDYQHFDKQSAG